MNYRLINSDVLAGLAQLPDESVQCVVTSPPYWGLRDYGTATWQGGGDPGCEHKRLAYPPGRETPGGRGGSMPMSETPYRETCGKCGASRIDAQLGLERTPEEYVARMVEVFRDVRRVLKSDGTCWINLGDSYASSTKGSGGKANSGLNAKRDNDGVVVGKSIVTFDQQRFALDDCGLKPKDLVGIPWLLAFALRADGWYLRSDIIWSKPNPMPESVTDRPTKAHEYLFLLTKSARYYYDADAIREANAPGTVARLASGPVAAIGMTGTKAAIQRGDSGGQYVDAEGRNRRSVWTIATEPFPEAHFATFPTALFEPCILAGSRIGDTVLDPFSGSGTTGIVAIGNQRDYIGIELNAEYVAMSRRRLGAVAPMFAKEAAV